MAFYIGEKGNVANNFVVDERQNVTIGNLKAFGTESIRLFGQTVHDVLPVVGTSAGFTAGGFKAFGPGFIKNPYGSPFAKPPGSSYYANTAIDRFPFAQASADGTDVGEMVTPSVVTQTGFHSETHAYLVAPPGSISPSPGSIAGDVGLKKYSFNSSATSTVSSQFHTLYENETVSPSNYIINPATHTTAPVMSPTAAYVQGHFTMGLNHPYISTPGTYGHGHTLKVHYSNDNTSAVIQNVWDNISGWPDPSPGGGQTCHSTVDEGFINKFIPPSPSNTNYHHKFPFASDAGATSVGQYSPTLLPIAYGLGQVATQDKQRAFLSGGNITPPGGSQASEAIISYPFSISSGTATDVGELVTAAGWPIDTGQYAPFAPLGAAGAQPFGGYQFAGPAAFGNDNQTSVNSPDRAFIIGMDLPDVSGNTPVPSHSPPYSYPNERIGTNKMQSFPFAMSSGSSVIVGSLAHSHGGGHQGASD